MTQTVVKRYKGEKAYQKDVARMAAAGYTVVSVVDQGKPGWRFLIGGTGVKRRYLVTYVRAD